VCQLINNITPLFVILIVAICSFFLSRLMEQSIGLIKKNDSNLYNRIRGNSNNSWIDRVGGMNNLTDGGVSVRLIYSLIMNKAPYVFTKKIRYVFVLNIVVICLCFVFLLLTFFC